MFGDIGAPQLLPLSGEVPLDQIGMCGNVLLADVALPVARDALKTNDFHNRVHLTGPNLDAHRDGRFGADPAHAITAAMNYLLRIAEEGQITRDAKLLCIARPAMRSRLQLLEEIWRRPVRRTRTGVKPTEAGSYEPLSQHR
ncbi:LysR family transcriptional regulator [Aldersonia sp. NBC_00410]|uniref:helix-turn-helix domain-containing protein n=1 Tax=Aldersonia sp. NBC_00410 TaxID=2975954 RepID=UPI00225B1707|nr:LysR family transcriptional regulator [Aldersonia sp. NBC_00410]MCX5045450.1 LysR family transcriptional regulator [Aldersonia sp. NBC_00410]